MATSARSSVDSEKIEIGEIDTSAPFESVKHAVSLFGDVLARTETSRARRAQGPKAERVLAKESELHLAQKELNKYKQQLSDAEAARAQALSELERAKKTVEILTNKLDAINQSKEQDIRAAEDANIRMRELDGGSSSETIEDDGPLLQELESVREQYAVVLADLNAAKQELRKTRKEFENSLNAKLSASQQEAESVQNSEANTESASELLSEIALIQESIMNAKASTEKANEEKTQILAARDEARKTHNAAMEETQRKLSTLRNDSEASKCLQEKLDETYAEIASLQKKYEDARARDLESVSAVSTELDDAIEMLQNVAGEESSISGLVESLRQELAAVKEERNQLKNKDEETESLVVDLQDKLRKCKSELEAAVVAESKATLSPDDLMSALQHLASESKYAFEEAKLMQQSADDLRYEAEAARASLVEAEEKLQSALKEAERAKGAESKALDRMKQLSDRANAIRASTAEPGAKIKISKWEFLSLSRKVEQSEKLTELKVAAAMAQVEAIRANGDEAIKKLEAARRELEDMELASVEAQKKAETSQAAYKAVESELKRQQEMEEKINAEKAPPPMEEESPATASSPSMQKSPRNIKVVLRRNFMLPSIAALFASKKKSHLSDYSSPS